MKRPAIVQAIRDSLRSYSKGIEVWLYGSEARGDARPDSDIDLLILVNGDTLSLEDEMKITEPLYRIELETGILINTFIILNKKWGTIVTPFYENVTKERIAL